MHIYYCHGNGDSMEKHDNCKKIIALVLVLATTYMPATRQQQAYSRMHGRHRIIHITTRKTNQQKSGRSGKDITNKKM